VQEIDRYLLPDLTAGAQRGKILRKELLEGHSTDLLAIRNDLNDSMKRTSPLEYREHSKELGNLSARLLAAIVEAVSELDSLAVYFMNPEELSDFFHGKGINLRYLGQVYDYLKTTFQRRILMSEMAARSCKGLFRKTLQDIQLEEAYLSSDVSFKGKVCDFFNCVLGMSFETAELWKVIAMHARSYFGTEINFSQIDRWYFLVSVVHHCRLKVDWEQINTEDAFKTNRFFGDHNLQGLRFHHSMYPPLYCPYHHLAL
jgi:hypothetical protein